MRLPVQSRPVRSSRPTQITSSANHAPKALDVKFWYSRRIPSSSEEAYISWSRRPRYRRRKRALRSPPKSLIIVTYHQISSPTRNRHVGIVRLAGLEYGGLILRASPKTNWRTFFSGAGIWHVRPGMTKVVQSCNWADFLMYVGLLVLWIIKFHFLCLFVISVCV